jgi:hypothetical protein
MCDRCSPQEQTRIRELHRLEIRDRLSGLLQQLVDGQLRLAALRVELAIIVEHRTAPRSASDSRQV